ncbi:ABC-type amino acid transport substrate-binding protein [Duganella sp. CF402]|uniref:substrate-binding periplasmic protein n=1 Tax=unclassified Duganella TaxID=2636909 RepID=UPI0008B3C75A|nr:MULTISPECIES: transporter substrate-binding domain-containing protein [unclassified Duganella]RZT08773.1 ABC-type amino acid transport substrate-binding protein [Duganella sp. BK701]SEL82552.1 ABC-type amino acid transport substrate-binding protein [Duganella sp. CF402]
MTMPPLRHLITVLLLAALLSCTLAPRAVAGPPTIPLIIGDTLDEQGKPKPLSPFKRKLLDAVERELGVVFELRMYPWARAERYAVDGAGLIFGLPKNADRLHALRYSDVAAYNKLWIVTRSDATFRFNGIEDLRGKSIGVVRGYNYGAEVEQARANKLFRTDEDIASRGTRLTRLMLKRVDAVLLFQPSQQTAREVETEVNTFMAPRLRAIGAAANASYSVLPKPLSIDDGVFFAIARSKDDGIIDRINAALTRLHQHTPN